MKYQRSKIILGKLRFKIIALGTACGLAATYWARPFQRHAENYNAIFRKPWMRLPIYSFAFICAFYGGIQLPSRIFYKFTPSKNEGISHAVYSSSQDMVSKFRLFETFEVDDPKSDITNYLTIYGTEPLTKSEMVSNIALHALKEFDVGKLFRVKRAGKDLDPLFWHFGKVHGIENLAYVDKEELRATNGNPVKIQNLVD